MEFETLPLIIVIIITTIVEKPLFGHRLFSSTLTF
jgi:hypothetical protein